MFYVKSKTVCLLKNYTYIYLYVCKWTFNFPALHTPGWKLKWEKIRGIQTTLGFFLWITTQIKHEEKCFITDWNPQAEC